MTSAVGPCVRTQTPDISSTPVPPQPLETSTQDSVALAAVCPPDIIEKLQDMQACDWDEVLEVLGPRKQELTDNALAHLVKVSATQVGFWEPEPQLLSQCLGVLRAKLAEWQPPLAAIGEEGSLASEDTAVTLAADRRNAMAMARSQTRGATCTKTWSAHLMEAASLHFTGCKTEDLRLPDEIAVGADKKGEKDHLLPPNEAASRLKQFKWALFFFVCVQMVVFGCYVVFYMTPKSWDFIGFPILVARSSAYGACFWTAILFLTMSRDVIVAIARLPLLRKSQFVMQFINCAKEIHIFSAYELMLDGCVHALMHHIGTFVALETHTPREINTMLVCATSSDNMPVGYLGKFFPNFLKSFQYPACPLPDIDDEVVGYFSGVLSTPGITGYLLMIVIFALGWFSRAKARKSNFRLFYAVHQLFVPAWVILLVLHGANNWVGLGFPLVILVSGVTIVTYAYTRLRRTYLCCRNASKIVCVDRSNNKRLLRLTVELAAGVYRQCHVGEYAYINVPRIGRTEWHPFTISRIEGSESGSQILTFCIQTAGIWTEKLSSLFDNAEARPRIYIDGPFYAPAVSMPSRSTVVGIGSGVGVTPFLAFLGRVATAGEEGLHKRAHVFWTSPWATDFLLFGDLLTEVDKRAASGGCDTTFHLHATPSSRNGPWNGKGIGSVFQLVTGEVWQGWKTRFSNRNDEMMPIFCKYPKPVHGVVSAALLDSKKPVSVAIGYPDFSAELLAIGNADKGEDVFVYYCGNPYMQKTVQNACIACNEQRIAQQESQRYYFYFERFG